MDSEASVHCTAFVNCTQLASGTVQDVAMAAKNWHETNDTQTLLVFDSNTGAAIDLALEGSLQQVEQRYQSPPAIVAIRKPGRPKLGVVGHEVTLLPRHWQWLRSQPGGASVALRKLVDQGRKDNAEVDDVRRARVAITTVCTALVGNIAGFEEAQRALYNNDLRRFNFEIELWPTDIKAFIGQLAPLAFKEIAID